MPRYHQWHHHPHHKKVHVGVLGVVVLLCISLVYNSVPKNAKAGNTFTARFDSSSLNADSGNGDTTAYNDGTAASLTAGYGGSGQAATASFGNTLKYKVDQNLDISQGSIEMNFQSPYALDGSENDSGKFSNPYAVTYDSSTEYYYIADTYNSRIVRTKIDGTGWASLGSEGYGVGQFNFPKGIATDGTYIYVSDTSNNRLVKTTIDGSTWETFGSQGNLKGQFNYPMGIYYDAVNEYFYVADQNNSRVVKTKWGATTNWTSYGGAGLNKFSFPTTVYFDEASDYIYVTDTQVMSKIMICRIHSDGSGFETFGTYSSNPTNPGEFIAPNGIRVVGSYIYITDGLMGTARIVKTDWGGNDWTTYGSYGSGEGNFNGIQNFFYDSGTWSIADTGNSRIVKTTDLSTWANWTTYGSSGKLTESFSYPQALSYDSETGNFYIADRSNSRIVKTNISGTIFETFGTNGSGTGQFNSPYGVYFDTVDDYLYVADYGNNRVVKTQWGGANWSVPCTPSQPRGVFFDRDNNYLYSTHSSGSLARATWNGSGWEGYTTWGSFGSGIGQFKTVYSIYVDSGVIYVADRMNSRIIRITSWGCASGDCWSAYGSYGTGDANLNNPNGVYFDSASQTAYIGDTSNGRIASVHWNGSGWDNRANYGSSGSGEGNFSNPAGVAYVGGYVYVADSSNGRLVKTQMDGTGWTTFSGNLEKYLFRTSGSAPMIISLNMLTNKIYFYVSRGGSIASIETSPLTFSSSEWHKVKAVYHNSTGEIKLYIDDVLNAEKSLDSWGEPTDLGDYFYIGCDPGEGSKAMGTGIDNIIIDSHSDSIAPSNPASVTALNQAGGSSIDADTWYNYSAPYFSWDEPSDTAGENEVVSGVDGYYVYFGTNSSADPSSDGSYQTGTTYTADNLVSGQTYYLFIETKDVAGNVQNINPGPEASLFNYQYDGTAPTNPANITASPSSWSSENSFVFTWPAGSDANSGLKQYLWRVHKADDTDTDWTAITELDNRTVTFTEATEGTNIFQLKTEDNASNISSVVPVNFYYNSSAPAQIQSDEIHVTPVTAEGSETPATENSFSFTWDVPSHTGDIAKYYYAFNPTPGTFTYANRANLSYTTSNSLPSGAWATQQNGNYLYVVAEDDQGNVNFDAPGVKVFYAQTPAPSPVSSPAIYDISNKDTRDWSLLVKWTAPDSMGAGFEGYTIYRCVNNKVKDACTESGDYSQIAELTGSGTTYVDTNLESDEDSPYSYVIKARDNAGQYSALNVSDVVEASSNAFMPTGKYTNPPKLDGSVIVTPKSFSATIQWKTIDDALEGQVTDANHTAQGFVYYSLNEDDLDSNDTSIIAEHDSNNLHTISISDLQPETTYYYKLIWKDLDGNIGTYRYKSGTADEPLTFTTDKSPTISSVEVKNITLNSATVKWESDSVKNSKITYCVKNSNECYEDNDNSGIDQKSHTLQLEDLKHTTTYHFEIKGYSEEGKVIKSDGYDFNTLTMPKIVGSVNVDQVEDAPTTTYRFSWKTNVGATSVVYYQNKSGSRQSKSSPDLVAEHQIEISNLADKSTYSFEVTGTDTHGNTVDNAYSEEVETPLDSRPPKISNLTIEVKSSGFGETQKAQLVVTWETDEPATSQVQYEQGISGSEYKNMSKEDMALSTSHVVILSELEPSKIYHLRAVSRDAAGNAGFSGDTTTITGKMQKSILDIIMNSLEKSLGWIFGIFR